MPKITQTFIRNNFLNLLLFSVLWGCQEPYDFNDLDANQKIPVIEAYLNNSDGPHTASLYYARPYNAESYEYITGAWVYIIDNHGRRYQLQEKGDGKYATERGDLRGVIGESYSLVVEIPGGMKIGSSMTRMNKPVEIDSAYFIGYSEWQEIIRDYSGRPMVVNKAGIMVNVVLKNLPKDAGYYRIQSDVIEHVWEIEPLSSTLIADEYGILFDSIFADIHHWYKVPTSIDPPRVGRLISDVDYSADDLTHLAFRTVHCSANNACPGYDFEDFTGSGWIIPFRVHTISPEMFQFYETQLAQLDASDRIYDPIPRQAYGNMYMVNGPDIPVLGMFEVSSVSKKNFFLEIDYVYDYDYIFKILPDTISLPERSGYQYGGQASFLIPVLELK